MVEQVSSSRFVTTSLRKMRTGKWMIAGKDDWTDQQVAQMLLSVCRYQYNSDYLSQVRIGQYRVGSTLSLRLEDVETWLLARDADESA